MFLNLDAYFVYLQAFSLCDDMPFFYGSFSQYVFDVEYAAYQTLA